MDPTEIKDYIIDNWEIISVGLENSTILFIGGMHGDKHGRLDGDANEEWVSLKNKVSLS